MQCFVFPCSFNCTCNFGITEKLECEDIEDTRDGVYTIYPGGRDTAVDVYCIIRQSKKWTVKFC